MYHLDKTRAESAPIKIYADLFISAAFSADDCIKRGVTILALVRKLQAIRPVELFVLMSSSMTSSWDTKKKREVFSPVIRIDTSPLDLATLSFLFGHPGFIRKLTFNWHWSKGVPSEIPFFEISEKDIPEMGPDDLLLKNAIFTRDVLNDPLKFINDQVQRFAQNVIE